MSSPSLERAFERSEIYQLLGLLWADAADRELLDRLAASSTDGMPPSWSELVASCDVDTEDLAAEFTRLLIGPKDHLPPFQSVWQEHQLGGEAASSMTRFGDLIGDDHIDDQLCSQLELMSRFLADAASNDDPVAVAELLSSYFKLHLTWPDQLLQAVAVRTKVGFFKHLAELTREFLADEATRFEPALT